MSAGLALAGVTAAIDARPVLRGVDLAVRPGELVALLGPNGAGKTTLLRVMAGLHPHAGSVAWDGRPVGAMPPRERARLIAYLPQGGVVGWPLPVAQVVALGRLPHGRTLGALAAADRVAVASAMDRADVAALADRPATALSGGERARVLLARALAVDAALLLADEPVASVDPRHQLAIMAALRDEARRGRAVVAVLHDLALATRFADRLVLLEAGRVAADGPPAVLTDEVAAAVFGVALARTLDGGRTVALPSALAEIRHG